MRDKRSGSSKPKPRAMILPVLIGAGVGVVIILLLLILFSLLLTIRDFGSMALVPMSMACVGIGAFSAGFVSSKINGKNGMATGMTSGTVLFVLFLLVSMIISGGAISLISLFRLIIMLVSSAIGGILGINIKRKRKYV